MNKLFDEVVLSFQLKCVYFGIRQFLNPQFLSFCAHFLFAIHSTMFLLSEWKIEKVSAASSTTLVKRGTTPEQKPIGPLEAKMWLKHWATLFFSLPCCILVLMTSMGLLKITEQKPAKPPEIKSTATLLFILDCKRFFVSANTTKRTPWLVDCLSTVGTTPQQRPPIPVAELILQIPWKMFLYWGSGQSLS